MPVVTLSCTRGDDQMVRLALCARWHWAAPVVTIRGARTVTLAMRT